MEGLRERQVVGGAKRPVAELVELEARRATADPAADKVPPVMPVL